jgi:glycosyltransferase involved in cell wall biosynthesis
MQQPPSIVIALPTLALQDAVGYDVHQMYMALNQEGYRCFLFAHEYPEDYDGTVLNIEQLELVLKCQKSLLICHYCVYWPALFEILDRARGKIWIRYHSVTPAYFFTNWGQGGYFATANSREQLKQMFLRYPIDRLVATSNYTRHESFLFAPHASQSVIPPFVPLHEQTSGLVDRQNDQHLLHEETLNILFVGRLAPNKGHLHLLRTLKAFREFYPDIAVRLHLAGNISEDLQGYLQFLQLQVREWELQHHVKFWGKVSTATLQDLYRSADVFLCQSEHEGFCVPLIEAQFYGLPILAWDKGAVGETLGHNQLIFQELDYELFAAALHQTYISEVLRMFLIKHGKENVKRFSESRTIGDWSKLIKSHFTQTSHSITSLQDAEQ